MVYVYEEFPKWKYHPTKPAVIVPDAESEKALGRDWYDSPAEAADALTAVSHAIGDRGKKT